MAEVKLEATRRAHTGKGTARRSRARGKVPGVVYGLGMEAAPIEVDRREFVTALQTEAGMNVLIDLQLDGDSILALTRELQRDPVKGTLLHADFVKVDRAQEIEVEVPVHLTGEAAGVGDGGVLEQPLHAVRVRCRPGDVPEAIDVDVSHLGIGHSVRVGDLTEGRAYAIVDDPETVIASIVAPISEEELEGLAAGVGAVPGIAPEEALATDEEEIRAAAEERDSDAGPAPVPEAESEPAAE